jgi:hypothetical protein
MYPQHGFSRAIRTTKAAITSSIGGRPAPVGIGPSSANETAMPVQDRVQRDQAMTTQRAGRPPHEGANTARSAQSMRGRGLVRRKTATSCRSTRSSTSLVTDVRLISRTSPSTCQEIKYSNRSDTLGSCPTSDHRWSASPAQLLASHRAMGGTTRRARWRQLRNGTHITTVLTEIGPTTRRPRP